MNAPMKLRLQHVSAYPNKDGTLRYYFRRRGQPMARLPDDPTLPEFMEAYRRNLDWVAPAVEATEGTFAWLCDQYMDSAEFKGKAPSTRAARRRVILSMMREPIDRRFPETFAAERAHKLTHRHVAVLRDRKAGNPNAANERLKILSQVFKLAMARGWRTDNPVKVIERLSVPRGGHATATDADMAAYFAKHVSGPAWLAMTILKHTGVRVSDLRILGRQHMHQGHLIFYTVKTGVKCELAIHPDLMAALPRDQMTFLTNEWGRPFASDKALSQRVAKWFRQAGVEGVTAHSVRKWRATKMAEQGATEMQLMSLFGWQDAKETRPYVQAANRRKMADEASAKYGNV